MLATRKGLSGACHQKKRQDGLRLGVEFAAMSHHVKLNGLSPND